MFTLIDVLRELGLRHDDPSTNWHLGAALRERYVQVYGEAPPKALGTKTAGAGSHCFATYPREFRPYAETLVLRVTAHMDRQMSLDL